MHNRIKAAVFLKWSLIHSQFVSRRIGSNSFGYTMLVSMGMAGKSRARISLRIKAEDPIGIRMRADKLVASMKGNPFCGPLLGNWLHHFNFSKCVSW
ncbi:hypothetical protein MPTK1_2g08270 [Marchantia polymorpha subsp. ruderalis]|uniref:Uncharacterized protein n=1 Tax=Marchantia polymorpha TaxID=3197 RepID=A0A2R6XGR6_MARPO|nr:hypothetical protein MARPO_0015s0111 [Marchantia polymorpha]BBN01548.1 hypothetical protein Mp_2g08270 [Marchantia polymorpha subsp. ruderalis]|eukprot:PTQ45313.1 hypothetical protein MARPO_0015s0111 [Marchantia polymorpha]